MENKQISAIVLIVAIVVVGAMFIASQAFTGKAVDTSLPSSKSAVALGDLIDLGALASTDGVAMDDTGYVTVMQTFIKTPNQKDLSADVSLQCGLVTDTTVKSKGGVSDSSTAVGKISVRVKATNLDNGNVYYFDPSEEGTSPDGGPKGVTYCSRSQKLEASFAGLNCKADLYTGVVTCEDPEVLRLLLETLDANAFNYVLADAPSGTWKIEVQVRAESNVALGGSGLGSAKAEAFVGLGSTRIETLRLIKGTQLDPMQAVTLE